MPTPTFTASSGQSMLSNVSSSPFQGCWVGERNDQSGSVRRSMIIFDISSIPSGSTINSATLRMYAQTDTSSNARTASVYRVKRLMVNGQNCWDNYSTGNAWQTAGGTGANDIDTTAIGTRAYSASESLPAWKEFSLNTTAISEMITGGSFPNAGTAQFLVKMATETDDAYDHDGHDETNPPELVIDYTIPTTTESVTKDLQYAILTQSLLQKDLDYTLLTDVLVQKSLAYRVIVTIAAITKGLTYAIVPPTLIPLALDYMVLTSAGITKDLAYRVLLEQVITKTMAYAIFTEGLLQKTLEYRLLLQTAITKDLQYVLLTEGLIQKTMQYHVGVGGYIYNYTDRGTEYNADYQYTERGNSYTDQYS